MVSRLPRAAALGRQLRMPGPAVRSQSTTQPPSEPSSSSPVHSTSSSSSEPRALSSGSTSRQPLLPESERRPPILPFYPVPRPPNFPSQFTAADGEQLPQAKLLNYPYPLWKPIPESERPKEIVGGNQKEKNEQVLSALTGLSTMELRNLRRVSVALQRVSHMTKKGRTRGYVAYQLVGDPTKGLVGLGRGAGTAMGDAIDKAFQQAAKNMDYVDRYEDRTVWGSGKELVGSFESTEVHLRARPPGFGLFVPHSVHRVLSICGIKDASASIRGSTHLVNVTKCVIQMLHGGGNPPGFGSGFGTPGKVENKGSGMRSKEEIERARGRYGVDIGRRV